MESKTSNESQAQLLQRIAAQDRQALTELYDQTGTIIFSTAMRIVGDASEAEEIVQDVFVQIWNKAATFNAVLGAPLHWVLGITRNRAIDRLRARQRRNRVLDEASRVQSGEASDRPLVNGHGLSADEVAGVRAAVKNLPAEQRQAIDMAFFGGLTHIEIATALNEPLGTVKARIRRGMLKLRENLQAYP